MARSDTDLTRLLWIIPFLAKRSGKPVNQVLKELKLNLSRLEELLQLISLHGVGPFTPDALIEASIEKGRVYVATPRRLARPLNLTALEAFSLRLVAQPLIEQGIQPHQKALKRALFKVDDALVGGKRQAAAELRRQISLETEGGEQAEKLTKLNSAIQRRREVGIDYLLGGTGEFSQRTVRPERLLFRDGRWYLIAYCLLRNALRAFRVDRIRELTVLKTSFEPLSHGEVDEAVRNLGRFETEDRVKVRVKFDPDIARWIAERVKKAEKMPDGSVVWTLDVPNVDYFIGWLLQYGDKAEVLEPPEVRQAVVKAAEKMMETAKGR